MHDVIATTLTVDDHPTSVTTRRERAAHAHQSLVASARADNIFASTQPFDRRLAERWLMLHRGVAETRPVSPRPSIRPNTIRKLCISGHKAVVVRRIKHMSTSVTMSGVPLRVMAVLNR